MSILLLAILLSFQSANEWYATGVRLAAAGSTGEAIRAYRQAVKENPRHVEAWNNLGDLLRRAGDRDGALDAIEHALAADPGHSRASLNAGILQIDAKHFKEALGFLQTARKGMGDQPALDYLFARAHLELNDYPSAKPYIARFRQSTPLSPAAALELATLLMGREENAEAAEMLLAIPEPGRTPETRIRLGQAWYALDQLENARNTFAEFLKMAPDDFRGRLWHGYAARGLGDIETAASDWQQALALNPESVDALVALADLELDQNRATEALALSERALRVNAESAAALLVDGLALLRLQRPSDAAAVLSRIPSSATEYSRALYPLSRAYRQIGDIEKADLALREFQTLDEAGRTQSPTPGRKRPE